MPFDSPLLHKVTTQKGGSLKSRLQDIHKRRLQETPRISCRMEASSFPEFSALLPLPRLVETMLLSISWNKVGPMMMCVN